MELTSQIVGSGFVSRYLDYVSVHEAKPSFHLVSLMALFAAALDRRLLILRGYTIRANVFALLYGPPASRKTYTIRITQRVFKDAGVEFAEIGENATEEGIVAAMARREEVGLSPSAVLIVEEFGTLLGGKKYQENLGRFLMRAYDGGPLGNTRKTNSYGTSDSFLTLLAGTTPEDLREIPESVLRTGFASRMWVVNEKGKAKRVWRPRFDPGKRRALAGELEGNLGRFAKEIRFDPGPEADRVFTEWYMGPAALFEQEADDRMGYWVGRRHEHAVRAAVLLYLLDGGEFGGMPAEAAKRGIAFVEAMEPGLFEAHGSLMATRWGLVWEKLTGMLRARKRVQVRHVMAALARWVETPQESAAALKAVRESGLARVEGEGGLAWIVWLGEE